MSSWSCLCLFAWCGCRSLFTICYSQAAYCQVAMIINREPLDFCEWTLRFKVFMIIYMELHGVLLIAQMWGCLDDITKIWHWTWHRGDMVCGLLALWNYWSHVIVISISIAQATNSGQTCLLWIVLTWIVLVFAAAVNGHVGVADVLLTYTADIEAKDQYGRTALMV